MSNLYITEELLGKINSLLDEEELILDVDGHVKDARSMKVTVVKKETHRSYGDNSLMMRWSICDMWVGTTRCKVVLTKGYNEDCHGMFVQGLKRTLLPDTVYAFVLSDEAEWLLDWSEPADDCATLFSSVSDYVSANYSSRIELPDCL